MVVGCLLLVCTINPTFGKVVNTTYKNQNETVFDDDSLDINFVYNITAALSNITLNEYSDSEIAKGRAFGTKGEHKADVASKFEVLEYEMVVTNITSGTCEVVDCYIAPPYVGPRDNPKQLSYNFSFTDLKIKPKPENLLALDPDLRKDDGDNYLFIAEEYEYNPDIYQPPLKRLLRKILGAYNTLILFWDLGHEIIQMNHWYRSYPGCQGLIHYDFNMDTYNMANNYGSWKLPVLNINGSIGKKIMDDLGNYTVSFYLNQTYLEQVESYNVIGTLEGHCKRKTVIIDCLYDSWWCQGTTDSAIGMGLVMGVAKYIHDHDIIPKYNIKFIGFCGEEQGLRGATYYEAAHKRENIIYMIDLNQLGFTQEKPEVHLDIIANKIGFLNKVYKIAEDTGYTEKTGIKLRKNWLPAGAPSDDKPFAMNRPRIKTVCFLKGLNWILHHRNGLNHTEGDVLKYFNWTDVDATGDIVLSVVKEFVLKD
jgi:hypothetical protein